MPESIHPNGAPQHPHKHNVEVPDKAICSDCKSDQVRFFGFATWETDGQYFDFEPTVSIFCLSCQELTIVDFVPLDPEASAIS